MFSLNFLFLVISLCYRGAASHWLWFISRTGCPASWEESLINHTWCTFHRSMQKTNIPVPSGLLRSQPSWHPTRMSPPARLPNSQSHAGGDCWHQVLSECLVLWEWKQMLVLWKTCPPRSPVVAGFQREQNQAQRRGDSCCAAHPRRLDSKYLSCDREVLSRSEDCMGLLGFQVRMFWVTRAQELCGPLLYTQTWVNRSEWNPKDVPWLVCCGAGNEPRALGGLGKHLTTELYAQPKILHF
jgi:hypothetical protein